jgi:TonB family protein
MNTVIALQLAVRLLGPFPSDTPPAPKPEEVARIASLHDVLAIARMPDGAAAPADLNLPRALNDHEVVRFILGHYPEALRGVGSKQNGFAWLQVGADGTVSGARLIKGTGRGALDDLALRALAITKFAPATIDARPVAVWIPYPVTILPYAQLQAWLRRSAQAAPVFTPYTKKPDLVNRDEVQRELLGRYPPELRRIGVSGTVLVWLFLSEDGEVVKVLVNESSGNPELDKAGLEVARVMKFTPAENDGRPVAVWIALPIVFDLRRR